jgi:hypothetical protein
MEEVSCKELTPEQEFFYAEGDKTIYLNQATVQAQLTKPTCCPPNIANPPPVPMLQSTGPDVVDRLANQLMQTIFPVVAPIVHVQLPEGADPETVREASVVEAAINYAFWNTKLPLVVQDLLKLAIVTSDAVALLDVANGKGKTYPLRDYIKLISHAGILDTLIVRDFVSTLEVAEENHEDTEVFKQYGKYWKYWYKYTRYQRLESGKYRVTTCTTGDKVIASETEDIPANQLEILHLEWEQNHAGSYGVGGPTQQATPDLIRLGKMLVALDNQLNGATRHLIGIGQQAEATAGKDVRTLPSGSTVAADPGEIYPIQMYDPKAVEMWMNVIPVTIQRIETIYGVAGGVQRDAERVTAAEVQGSNQSRVGKHGGIYLRLEEYVQRPIVAMLVRNFIKKPDKYNFKVASGYAASLQYPNAQALEHWTTTMNQLQQSPQLFETTLNMPRFGNLLAEALNLNLSSAYLTQEERQQAEQAKQEAEVRQAALQQAQQQPLEQPQPQPPGQL